MVRGRDYDGDIQMFVEGPREIDLAHLRFLRWLAERGNLEHKPAGRSYGVYALGDVLLSGTEAVPSGAASARGERSD